MPTFKICVQKHQERRDGKFPVSIRITHNRQIKYLKTDIYVVRKQITPDFTGVKDTTITRRIDRDIIEYENLLLRGLGANLGKYTAKELVDYIEKHNATQGGAAIDFAAYFRGHIDKLKSEGRKSYAQNFESVLRALYDFFGRETINVKEITSKMLKEFEGFLMSKRTIYRVNQLKKTVKTTNKPVSEQTVSDYVKKIQIVFNAACDHYNDEENETALITHNPFRKYSIKVTEEPEKRNLGVEDLRKIIACDDAVGRAALARDVFLISFYFIGMNTADIFKAEKSELSKGRLTYKRQKTATRRKDEALISIRVEPEIKPLLKRYKDPYNKRLFSFYKHYTDYRGFNTAVNKGAKALAAHLKIKAPLSSYYMRHTWATLAANECGISESDIGLCLNHLGHDKQSAKSLKVTRGYIGRDWTKIDNFHRQVLDFVSSSTAESK